MTVQTQHIVTIIPNTTTPVVGGSIDSGTVIVTISNPITK